MQTLKNFDIFTLSETFVDDDKLSYMHFKEYDVFCSKAIKLSHCGRKSGGVLVFVKKSFSEFVERVEVSYDHTIVLKLNKNLFCLDKDVFLICTYVHPYDSKYWQFTNKGYGMEVLEQCLIDLFERMSDFYLIICGDFNARTGNYNTKFINLQNVVLEEEEGDDSEERKWQRKSDDEEMNAFGKHFLDLCAMSDCVIINGLCTFDFDKNLTYIGPNGGSLVDYFVLSRDLCTNDFISTFNVESLIESPHFPLKMILYTKHNRSQDASKHQENKVEWIRKLIWDEKKEEEFIFTFNSSVNQDTCQKALEKIDENVEEALELYTSSLRAASACMIKRVKVGGAARHTKWFDEQCVAAKQTARRALHRFRRSKLTQDRSSYVEARKIYKALINKKKAMFKSNRAEYLASLETNPKLFWREVKQISGNKKQGICDDISEAEWHDHFKKLFNENTVIEKDLAFEEQITVAPTNDNELCFDLNKPISAVEVREAINKLKARKACGIDTILAEMLKLSGETTVIFFTKLFNRIFDYGTYPSDWAKAIIVPIFKKGDFKLTDNYRGVSLLSLMSKCFTSVLNKRLVMWVEKHKILTESQAGFRKDYSTADHIFTLNAIVERSLSKRKGKLYACFVDLRKAFDSIQHQPLFEILLKRNNIDGKFMKSIISIYKTVSSCIRIKDKLTEFFECPVGLRQGCILSPELFLLFVNEVAVDINNNGMHGIQLMPNLSDLFLLLFADDVVLLSSTPRGLQNQLNVLNDACKRLYLKINLEKTKVIVFRKGGFLGAAEKWHIDGNNLEIVNEYNYLGFLFTTKMSINKGVEALAQKGRKACFECVKNISKLREITRKSYFKIFDTQIQPILLYASEMWGLNRLENIERIHTLACKRYLNVPMGVYNKFIYGETGRYPLYINSAVRCIRYWLKLLKLDVNRIPKQAYVMLINLDEKGKDCWVTKLKNTLFSLGFGYVWIQQSVGCENGFVKIFKQRIKDTHIQEWDSSVKEKEKYQNYRTFKHLFRTENYLDFIHIKSFRDCLIKLRLGVLPLKASSFRLDVNVFGNKMCAVCDEMETENHFISNCPLYNDIRAQYLTFHFQCYLHILQNNSKFQLWRLCLFIFHALKRRDIFYEELQTT